jgi:hypothetical protein
MYYLHVDGGDSPDEGADHHGAFERHLMGFQPQVLDAATGRARFTGVEALYRPRSAPGAQSGAGSTGREA